MPRAIKGGACVAGNVSYLKRMSFITLTMRRLIAASLFLLMLAGLAQADQNGSRDHASLDRLFADLAVAASDDESQAIVQDIWAYWLIDTDDSMNIRMMRNGIGLMQMMDLRNAEDTFTRVINRDENFTEAWNKRATIRYMIGNFDGSESDIAEVLKREPRHFGALSGLAMINIKRGDLQTALTLYENILLIHPRNRDALTLIPELRKTLQGDPA